MSTSPLIKDGALSLTENGDLVSDLDIITQMATALAAYHCIFNDYMNSQLIPYLDNKAISFTNRPAISNVCVNAYQYLITQKIISNLTVSVKPQTISTIKIDISAIDTQGNNIELNWTNP